MNMIVFNYICAGITAFGALAVFFTWIHNVIKKRGSIEEKFNTIDVKFDNVEKRLGTMEDKINTMEGKINSMECKISTIEDKISTIVKNIDFIIHTIFENKIEFNENFSKKQSPTQLNENGIKLYKEINGEDFLLKNKDFFISRIESKNYKTALDIEKGSYIVLLENTNNDIFNNLKNWVFNSPAIEIIKKDGKKEQYEVTIYDICYILSIPLRDMYLELHNEILTEVK